MGELQLDSLIQQLQAGFLPLCDRCETLLTLRPPFQQLREKGYTIVATTPHKDAYTPQDLPLDKPIALFFGAEKHGISEELSKEADYFVFKGKLKNQAYSKSSEPIRILKKDKTIEDVVGASDQLHLKALSKPVTKYFICFPKVVLEV